jgi:hypothetical protein
MLALAPGAALAHERRTVGDYSFLVGFNNEPAIQGEMNGAQITVTKPSDGNRPVTGLQNTLKVSVAFGGGQPKEFPVTAVSSTPGRYVAGFIPTRAGSYIFTITGTAEEQPVNERFESGPGRFDDVDSATTLQFPDQVPLANDATRAAQSAAAQASEAQAAADSARSIAIAGVLAGVFGIAVGIAGLVAGASRRRAPVADVRTA